MYMVYWTIEEGESHTPHAQPFATTAMVEAMRFMEDLRRRQRRVHGHGKKRNADGAAQNDEQGADRRKNRPMNKKVDKQDKPAFLQEGKLLLQPALAAQLLCGRC